ncbi:hypothetical protein NKG05_25485 [Oerskovia sp. M15]
MFDSWFARGTFAPEHLWPYYAEHPSALETYLGMRPASTVSSQSRSDRLQIALSILAASPRSPPATSRASPSSHSGRARRTASPRSRCSSRMQAPTVWPSRVARRQGRDPRHRRSLVAAAGRSGRDPSAARSTDQGTPRGGPGGDAQRTRGAGRRHQHRRRPRAPARRGHQGAPGQGTGQHRLVPRGRSARAAVGGGRVTRAGGRREMVGRARGQAQGPERTRPDLPLRVAARRPEPGGAGSVRARVVDRSGHQGPNGRGEPDLRRRRGAAAVRPVPALVQAAPQYYEAAAAKTVDQHHQDAFREHQRNYLGSAISDKGCSR